MIVVPEGPRCSRCGEFVRIAVQFWACSGEHGFNFPDNRGSKRSVRLCADCLEDLTNEMCAAAAVVIAAPAKLRKAKPRRRSRRSP